MLKHYVEYLYPGIIFSETSVKEIPERTVSNIEIPAQSFGYRFFDRTVTVVDGKSLIGEKSHISGWHYQGKKMTIEQVKATYGNDSEYETLISNMEINGYTAVVQTKFGQFMPMRNDDTII